MKKLLFLIMSIATVFPSFAMEQKLRRYELEKDNQRRQYEILQVREQAKVLQEYVDKRPYVNRDILFQYFKDTGYTLMEAILKKDTSEMRKAIESIPSKLRPILVNGFIDEFIHDDCNKRVYPHLYTLTSRLGFGRGGAGSIILSPLKVAVIARDEKILEALFGCGTPIDVNKGFPLEIAINWNSKAIPFLLQKGVNAEGIDNALYYAVLRQCPDAAQQLLQAGASLKSRDSKSDMTPLQAACVKDTIVWKNDYMVEFLLKNGAFIDETDSHGRTLLHWTVEHEKSEERNLITDFLLEHGANVLAKDKAGRTVIECMSSTSFDAMDGVRLLGCGAPYPTAAFHQDMLEDRGRETNKNLSFVLKDSSEFFKSYFRTLIKADTQGALAAIKKLAATKGANVDDINKAGPIDGLKPLHWAVVRNNHKVVEGLVANRTTLQNLAPQLPAFIIAFCDRIDINCRDSKGRTPLMWAARLGYTQIYQHLVRGGARTELRDEKGKMALNYAADYRNIDIIREMIIDGTLSAKPVTNQN